MMKLAFACLSSLVLAACSVGLSQSHRAEEASETVVLETTLGDIVIDVYTERAPLSAAHFLQYVDDGLYENEGFYRAVRPETDPYGWGMELIQGGIIGLDESEDTIAHETTEMTGLSHVNGAVSLARGEVGTGSAAYFFICIGDRNTFLDYGGARNPDGQGYAVFGQVVEGMDVVRAIQSQETNGPSDSEYTKDQYLTNPVIITRARRK